MSGFTPIDEAAFIDLIERLPKQHRLGARSICLDLLFHARRNTGTEGGVELKRGQVLYSERGVAQRCYVSYQKTRTVFSWLKKVHFLTHKSTQSGSVVSIVEFGRYVSDRRAINADTNDQPTHNQRNTKGKGVKDSNINTLKNPEEARQALRCWTDHADLPASANEQECLKILDELHRLDGVPWDGTTGIYAICEYAAKEWVPKSYIRAPAVLRKKTRAGDQLKFEAIQQQITARHSQTAANGVAQPPGYEISYSTGDPVTSFTKRMRRIVDSGLDIDPDHGHEWSIPDDEIAHAKAEGIDTFLKQRQQTSGADHAA